MDSKTRSLLLIIGSLLTSLTVAATTTDLNVGETQSRSQKVNLEAINNEITKQEREVANVVDQIIIRDKTVSEAPRKEFSLRLNHEARDLIGGSLRD